jgi:hypothetical protein
MWHSQRRLEIITRLWQCSFIIGFLFCLFSFDYCSARLSTPYCFSFRLLVSSHLSLKSTRFVCKAQVYFKYSGTQTEQSQRFSLTERKSNMWTCIVAISVISFMLDYMGNRHIKTCIFYYICFPFSWRSCCSIFSFLCSVLYILVFLFVFFSFDYCSVCLSTTYWFWLHLWYL